MPLMGLISRGVAVGGLMFGRSLGVAPLIAAALLLVSCGDDDDTTDGATAGATSTVAAATDRASTAAPTTASGSSTVAPTRATTSATPSTDPIKLMVIHEVEAGAANPEIAEGAKAAAAAINASGGVRGRSIEVISCDTRNDPNGAAECGRQALDDGVVAVVGAITPHDGEFLPLLEQHEIPSVGQLPLTPASYASPVVFSMSGGSPTNFAGLATALAEAGATKIALARIDVDAAAALGQFAGMGLSRYGLAVTHDVPVPLGTPDMSTYAAAALADGVDGVIVGVTAQDAINLIQALRQAKPDVKIAMIATQAGDVIDALGAQADGLLRSVDLSDEVDTAHAQQYRADMAAAGYDDLTAFRINGWASVRLVADVAADLEEVTAPALLEAFNTVTSIRTGVSAPLQWKQPAIPDLPRVFNLCMLTLEISGGGEAPTTGTFTDVVTGADCPSP